MVCNLAKQMMCMILILIAPAFFLAGTLPCSEGEPLTISFDWRFLNHGTELAIFAAPEKINRLDENYLEVYYMDENLQGQPVKYIRRFRH